MLKKLLPLLLLAFAPASYAQTASTAPTVLGCANPAPAVAGQPTVFISKCTTPAFLPVTTSSVVASASKTAPVWAHSFTGYTATTLIVACPKGAVVSGGSCTVNGVDASGLIAQSAVATFAVAATPPPPPPPAIVNITITMSGMPAVTWQNVPAGSCFSITDGTHTAQTCAPTN